MLTFQTFSRKPDTLLHSDDDSTKLGQHIKNRIRKYTEVVFFFFLGPSSMRFGCQGLKNQFELAAAQNWNSRKSLPIFKASHFISATLLQFPSLKSRANRGWNSPDFLASPGNGESRGEGNIPRDSPGNAFFIVNHRQNPNFQGFLQLSWIKSTLFH